MSSILISGCSEGIASLTIRTVMEQVKLIKNPLKAIMKLRKNFMTMSADEYDTSSETYIACNKQINNWYISELGVEPLELGDKQLDLGCGPGAALLNNYRMLGNHMQITGIDVNEKYLASSREKFKKFKPRHMTTAFVNYDAGNYNAKDEIFPRQFCGTSLITSSCMLHWIQDDRTVLRTTSTKNYFGSFFKD